MKRKERRPGETGREYALRVLKSNIISMDLAPGEQISENELTKWLELSRTPVREALIELGKTNVVEVIPQKGTYVALIDDTLVEEARFMRLTLECAVVRELCAREEVMDFSELDTNLVLEQYYVDTGDREKLMELDNDFHRRLFEMAQKSHIYELVFGFMIHFDRLRRIQLNVVSNQYVVDDHKRVLEAVRQKNADQAMELMTRHLSRHQLDYDRIRHDYPQYFKE